VGVAPLAKLAIEPHPVVATLVPALEQRGLVRRQQPLPRRAVRTLRLGRLGQGAIPIDRPAADADAPGAVGHVGPGVVQAPDRLVLLDEVRVALAARLLGPLLAAPWSAGGERAGGDIARHLDRLAGHGRRAQRRALVQQELFQPFGQVMDQVPAVGDLGRLRGTATRGVGVQPAAIADDRDDARALAQPCGGAFRRAICQQIEHPVALQVDEDRPEAMAPAPGPFVDAHDPGRRFRGRRDRADEGEQRGAPHRQVEGGGESRARRPAQREPDTLEGGAEGGGSSRVALDEVRESLGEDAPQAGRVPAEEAAHLHQQAWCNGRCHQPQPGVRSGTAPGLVVRA